MAAFNTTVASFNVGYADFFTEHMKKLCTPAAAAHDALPSEPLACSNLPRSLTDSCINYSCLEDGESIEGTNHFILKNGMLDLTVSPGGRGGTPRCPRLITLTPGVIISPLMYTLIVCLHVLALSVCNYCLFVKQ